MERSLLVAVALLALTVGPSAQQNVQQCQNHCNNGNFNQFSSIKIPMDQGYEFGLETYTYNGPHHNKYQRFSMAYGTGNGKGAYYSAEYQAGESLQYDLNEKWSYLITNGGTSSQQNCDARTISTMNKYSYMHGNDQIFLFENFFDLTKFKFETTVGVEENYNGVDSMAYTGCDSDNDGTSYQVTWHISEGWTNEGAVQNYPLAMDFCMLKNGATYTMTAKIVNFHNVLYVAPGSGPYHALFTHPSERFCPMNGGRPQTPVLEQRYSFRGEYTSEINKTASPILVAYDSKYDLIRYDFLPVNHESQRGFTHSWLQDGATGAGVKYSLDLQSGYCKAFQMSDNSVVDFTKGAMAIVGNQRLNNAALGKLDHVVGVKPCRRMACDWFISGDNDYVYEYSFLQDDWASMNEGSINASMHNVLAHVGRASQSNSKDVESVEIFDFANDKAKMYQYEIAQFCYINPDGNVFKHSHIRIYFTGDHNQLLMQRNAFLRSALIEAAADAAKVSPMRVSDIVFDVFHDQLNAEFVIWEPNPVLGNTVSLKRPTPLEQAVSNLKAVVQSGKFVVNVGDSSQTNTFSLTADPGSFEDCPSQCSKLDPAGIKLEYSDGFSMGMQIAIYIPPLPPILENMLPFKTPFTNTYYLEAYHGYPESGHGSLYVYDHTDNYKIVYNERDKESLLIWESDAHCENQTMRIDDSIFPFGYLHGGLPVPLPDVLADMTKWQTKGLVSRGKEWYHGFKVNVYEANADIGEIAGTQLPTTVPFRMRWYWLDPQFESEDGQSYKAGPVPIAIRAQATVPSVPGFQQYAGKTAEVTVSIVNYHNHYPSVWTSTGAPGSKDPFREMLEVPRGVNCPRNRGPESEAKVPALPSLPKRFKMKTETVVQAPIQYVINSNDYLDYTRGLFRYDISMHNAQKPGLMAVTQVTIDENEDIYFKIDHEAKPACTHGTLEEAKNGKDPILRHVVLASSELLNLNNLNEQYQGIKVCRDMSCDYWIGERDITSLKDHHGKFEIWAKTAKWDTIEDAADGRSTTFIKIAATITNTKTKEVYMKEEIEIYDMALLSPKDINTFAAPTLAYCRGDSANPIDIPKSYTYRGEYVAYDKHAVTTFSALFDNDNALFRYDHAPSAETGEANAYRSTWIIDQTADILLDANRVSNECKIMAGAINTVKSMEILELIYPDTLRNSVGDYGGAAACRSKACEVFRLQTQPVNNGWQEVETYFTTDNWLEFNSDNPFHVDVNTLARIAHNDYKTDGSIIASTHKSVDVFGFTTDVVHEWDFRWLVPCFTQYKWQHFRLSITDDNGGGNLPPADEYFFYQMVHFIAAATGVKPYRILNAKFVKFNNEIRMSFSMTERPDEDTVGVKLADAVKALESAVKQPFVIEVQNFHTGGNEPMMVRINSVTDCGTEECDINANRPVIYEFDALTAFGVFFGCFIGGALLTFIGLAFLYSKRLQVPPKQVFLSGSSGSGATPVNLSGLNYR